MAPTGKLPACGFFVTLNPTDFSLPVRIKKVGKRKLTILSNITGSRKAAADTLKQIMGVGGDVNYEYPDSIELQGDQTGRLTTTLRNLGALRGEPVQSGPTVVVPPKQGFEKFMKSKSDKSKTQIVVGNDQEMSKACIIVHGRYWPYCNGNCQHCPPLTDVFEGVDVYCSWYNPDDRREELKSRNKVESETMTKEELDAAFAELGMRAEVGEAVKAFQKEKHMKPWLTKPAVVVAEKPIVPKPEIPKPVIPKKKPAFVDRPVLVILNKPAEPEDSEYFITEMALVDHSMWMSEYEYFVVSLLAETGTVLANHEMIDSRTLKLLFFDRSNMEKCGAILNEVMPNFFHLTNRDRTTSVEEFETFEEPQEIVEPDVPNFERMAEELGLDSSEEFWRFFTHFIDQSDGSTGGILRAFQQAVLHVTSPSPS